MSRELGQTEWDKDDWSSMSLPDRLRVTMSARVMCALIGGEK